MTTNGTGVDRDTDGSSGESTTRADSGSRGPIRRYDLQVHTDASPCSAASPAEMAVAAVEAGLDGIAVTNHDTTEGVREVRHAVSGLEGELDVISGVEVTTTQGHLLALGVSESPPQADPVTVIENVHEQGGVAVLSHPFDRLRQVYDRDLGAVAAAVDGVEVCNSRCVRAGYNAEAKRFASGHGLARTGGSDAHFPREVGRAVTECRGDVIASIREGKTRGVGRGGYLSGHVATKIHQFRRLVA